MEQVNEIAQTMKTYMGNKKTLARPLTYAG
jgi:hypothetical protein